MIAAPELNAEHIEVPDDLDEVNDYFAERNWTDGLPVVPPTPERVRLMLEYTDLDPGHVLDQVPPNWADATVELVAINAVMAGCKPEYLPVVIAAVEAICVRDFNLYGIQATTNPVTPLLVVNGPIARELGINGGGNVFGQGNRANATIGRAVRLVMMNVGGGIPQTMDMSTAGQPGKYGFCIAENEQESPWEPLHVEQGLAPEVSAVTALAVTGTQNMLDMASKSAKGLLQTYCSHMATVGMQNIYLGGGPVVALCPEHAQMLAQEGFSKQDVKRYLYEQARVPLHEFSKENITEVLEKRRPKWYTSANPFTSVTIADEPDLITIIVTGGPGPHSQFLPTFGEATTVSTRPIANRDGRPVKSVRDLRRNGT
jgi:hypothetical protein